MVKHNITVEDSSPLIIYNGIWVDSLRNAPDYEMYTGYSIPDFSSWHKTLTPASFDLNFNGTGVYVYGTRSPSGGNYEVNLLLPSHVGSVGGLVVDVFNGSSFSWNTSYQSLLYSYEGLNRSQFHSLVVSNEGETDFILDYIIVENEIGNETVSLHSITLDDTSSAFSYLSGSWNDTILPNDPLTKYYDNGTEHYTTDIGAEVKIDFQGSGIEVHGTWQLGGYLAQLDDRETVPATRAPINSSTFGIIKRPRELLCMFDGLDEDNHTLVLTNTGGTATGFGGMEALHIDYAIVYTSDPTNVEGIARPGNATESPPPTAGAVSSSNSSQSSLAALVGGIIGSVALLIIIIMGILFWRCRQKSRPNSHRITDLLDGESSRSTVILPPPPSPFSALSPFNPPAVASRPSPSVLSVSAAHPHAVLSPPTQSRHSDGYDYDYDKPTPHTTRLLHPYSPSAFSHCARERPYLLPLHLDTPSKVHDQAPRVTARPMLGRSTKSQYVDIWVRSLQSIDVSPTHSWRDTSAQSTDTG